VPTRIFITVAEVSGDQHAAQLVRSLKQLDPSLVIEGIGGPLMREAGCVIHHETVRKAAMGLGGAFRYFEIKPVFNWARRYFRDHRPDLQIGVDSPSMNFHFAKHAHSLGVPVLQYVAPQLWAWREGRMRKVRKWIDHVACILPFEEAYFRGHGVAATFVGHPLFDELPPARTPAPAGERFPHHPPAIGLLPGSRKGEAVNHAGPMLAVAARVFARHPAARFLIPTTAATDPIVRHELARAAGPLPVDVQLDAFDSLVPQCDLCVTASGTATLHVAGHNVPMVVVYGGNRLLWYGLAKWLVTTDTFALVNLLSANRRHVVPELIPWWGDPVPVADVVLDFLANPDKLEAQRRDLHALVSTLDRPGASTSVAKLALGMVRGASAVGASS